MHVFSESSQSVGPWARDQLLVLATYGQRTSGEEYSEGMTGIKHTLQYRYIITGLHCVENLYQHQQYQCTVALL